MATYSFDEQSVKRIGDAVRKIERLGGDTNQPPIEYETTSQSFRTVIRGQFTGEWGIRTDATVSFVADNGDTGTKTAHNYFATVGAAGETNNCCIIQAGGEWILIAYETTSQSFGTVIRGTFSGAWAKNATANVSFTADNGDTGTKTATNYFADVGTAGESSACCIIQAGGEWILIAAECG